ncbi:hypothetical protein CR152_32295 (plasmid) [Massilia violaceinigra]|uniref:Transcriptional regulator n=1 Tax=Massilia violaceinigra TaxID=2045208 RepID=A0A2D2DWA5_9BURK|nr:hypothetical protein [Massilia violaceinigra]ATQ79258.1 hypothetical protein CR152_32295 [Massilia violaceinigra]
MKSSIADEERTLFAQRLVSAMKSAEICCSPAQVARGFNLRASGATVTLHAARKWLLGQAIPTQGNVQVLADWTGVNAAWLRFGEGERCRNMSSMSPDSRTDARMVSMVNDLRSLPQQSRKLVRGLIDVLMDAQAFKQDGDLKL